MLPVMMLLLKAKARILLKATTLLRMAYFLKTRVTYSMCLKYL